jgi:carbonic anhydrase
MSSQRVEGPDPFADVISANERHASSYRLVQKDGVATRGLAVVTCMDSRIDPLAMLGLTAGEAKILRNAGARATDDALRGLLLAVYLLGVNRVMLVAHTGCRMSGGTDADVREAIMASGGPDTADLTFLTTQDQEATVRADVQRVLSWPYLPLLEVGGFIYDLDTGRLRRIC